MKQRIFLAARIGRYLTWIGLGLIVMWMGADPWSSGLMVWSTR